MEQKPNGLIRMLELARVFPPPEVIRGRADRIRANNPGRTPQGLSKQLASVAVWQITGAGVVASLPGAVPGLGTVVQIGVGGATMSAETWLMLRNLTVLHLMVAALMGHDPGSDERKTELLLVWGLTTGAIVPAKVATTRVGTKVAIKQFNTRVTGEMLRRINQRLGVTVFTKWGTKRGGVALGRLIPLGVGTVVGGGMNYVMARGFATSTLKLYTDLLPGDAEVTIDGE